MHDDVIVALMTPDAPSIWRAGASGGLRRAGSIHERLFARTVRTAQGCLVKSSHKKHQSYVIISIANHPVHAHRVVFFLTHRYWPPVVRHTCDNKKCIEITHLLGGTHADNTNDAKERGLLVGNKQDTCKRNHDLTVEGSRYKSGGCKQCSRQSSLDRYYKKKGQTMTYETLTTGGPT